MILIVCENGLIRDFRMSGEQLPTLLDGWFSVDIGGDDYNFHWPHPKGASSCKWDGFRVVPAEKTSADIIEEIAALEATVTNRRLREAALTEDGKAWLADVDARIAALRGTL